MYEYVDFLTNQWPVGQGRAMISVLNAGGPGFTDWTFRINIFEV